MHPPVQTIPEAPLVSIIVPVYNLETCVSSCLDSLLRQTWSPLEIILVNDGSTDDSAALLETCAAEKATLGRLRVLHLPHRGIVAALGGDLVADEGREAFAVRTRVVVGEGQIGLHGAPGSGKPGHCTGRLTLEWRP